MFRWITLFFSLFACLQTETIFAEKSPKKISAEYPLQCPKDWEVIQDRAQLPKKIALVFVGSKKGSFAPSINLATEISNLSIDAYLQAAEEYHKKVAGTIVTKLGKFATKSGDLELLQIDRSTTWGDVRFIQGAMIDKNHAYVITATCLTSDFAQLSKTIFSTLQSFTLPQLESKNTTDK